MRHKQSQNRLKWQKKQGDLYPYYVGMLGKIRVAYVYFDRHRSSNIPEDFSAIIKLPGLKETDRKMRFYTIDQAFYDTERVIFYWLKRAGLGK